MRILRNIVVVVMALVLVLLLGGLALYYYQQWQSAKAQEPLAAFYTPPEFIDGEPGTVIRSESAPEWNVPGSDAQRILYVTEGVDGVRRVAGGTVWIPQKAGQGPRKVVAWGHGTIGLGDECAPSRNPAYVPTTSPWIQQMIANGWIVTASDYQGLGTPPPYSFLVGRAEAVDIVNSVRAARSLPGAAASNDWGMFGISQGGHAALWAGDLAAELAPELRLRGVAAVSPAGPLKVILEQQWDTGVAWAIGPEVMVSWPSWEPGLDPMAVVSETGQGTTESQALDCVQQAALFGIARQEVGQRYFTQDPTTDPQWAAAIARQTPRPYRDDLPLLVPIGTEDNVVLPTSIASMQEEWCRVGVNLTMDWMGGINHLQAAQVAAPNVVNWLSDRFDGKPTQPNCRQNPPVAPYESSGR